MDRKYLAYRRKLIHVLQMAYSGEKSAALAYQGHAKAVTCPEEKALIQRIEGEEWHHRKRVGEILAEINAKPSAIREINQLVIGHTLKIMCPFSGWFLPMYVAWKIEEKNIEEYADAKKYAIALGLNEVAEELQKMSDVEQEHAERFSELIRNAKPFPKIGAIILVLINLALYKKI